MRAFTRLAALLAAGLAAHASVAYGQKFPERPVSLVSPHAAGGAVDFIARLLAPKVAEVLGGPVIVVNKVGGGGVVGATFVTQAAPDGHTILVEGTPFAINVAANRSVGFDPQRDLMPVAMVVAMGNLVTVTRSLPVQTIEELIRYGKANPGKLNYGSGANGNLGHFNAEKFSLMTGIKMVRIGYKGIAPMLPDLVAGRVQVTFENLPPMLPLVKSGDLRPLAVTSIKRSAALPDVPTLHELGLTGFDNTAWIAVWVPKGTPQRVVSMLTNALTAAVEDKGVVEGLTKAGMEPSAGGPDRVRGQLLTDIEKFRKIISEANITIE